MATASTRSPCPSAAGEVLWHKHVPTEIGEDTHVDCVLIGEFQPGGRRLVTSTGGCMFDADGRSAVDAARPH